ncbi:hypothetical protein GDO81_026074 [Engystomops pustulosus]|uniref:Uncharacterized protein n=1 Tax=Engystomops pustulosus TaxID=76066 RepID=A0AAV6ZPS6_ENGPU|nr:hypothetical protein GDO81_026074 [Engystomops pustulosus]
MIPLHCLLVDRCTRATRSLPLINLMMVINLQDPTCESLLLLTSLSSSGFASTLSFLKLITAAEISR